VEANSILMLAKARQTEWQAEVEHFRCGRQEAAVMPSFSELLIAGAERVARVWAKLSTVRRAGLSAQRTRLLTSSHVPHPLGSRHDPFLVTSRGVR
jgi:hypothetical protein